MTQKELKQKTDQPRKPGSLTPGKLDQLIDKAIEAGNQLNVNEPKLTKPVG